MGNDVDTVRRVPSFPSRVPSFPTRVPSLREMVREVRDVFDDPKAVIPRTDSQGYNLYALGFIERV